MRTKLYMTNTFHSLIRGKLKTANGTYTEGYFIVDTACTNSIVNEMFCSEEFLKKDMTFNLIGEEMNPKKQKYIIIPILLKMKNFVIISKKQVISMR